MCCSLLLLHEGFQSFSRFLGGDALAAVVQVDEDIAVVAHAQFLHVRQLAQAVAAFDALQHVVVFLFGHGVDNIDAGLIDGEQVGRGQDADVGRDYRFGFQALAVTGHRHVTHHVDIGHVLPEVVDTCLGRFGHAFHEFLLLDVPLVILAGCRVNSCLADASVSTADADVLVRAAETALRVSLEMGECHHCVVVRQV